MVNLWFYFDVRMFLYTFVYESNTWVMRRGETSTVSLHFFKNNKFICTLFYMVQGYRLYCRFDSQFQSLVFMLIFVDERERNRYFGGSCLWDDNPDYFLYMFVHMYSHTLLNNNSQKLWKIKNYIEDNNLPVYEIQKTKKGNTVSQWHTLKLKTVFFNILGRYVSGLYLQKPITMDDHT